LRLILPSQLFPRILPRSSRTCSRRSWPRLLTLLFSFSRGAPRASPRTRVVRFNKEFNKAIFRECTRNLVRFAADVSRVRVLLAFFKVQFFIYISPPDIESGINEGAAFCRNCRGESGFCRSTCDCKSCHSCTSSALSLSRTLPYRDCFSSCISVDLAAADITRSRSCRIREWRVNPCCRQSREPTLDLLIRSKCDPARDRQAYAIDSSVRAGADLEEVGRFDLARCDEISKIEFSGHEPRAKILPLDRFLQITM